MKKTWKLIVHEYTRHVLRKRFILALLSVPLWIAISLGAGFLSVFLQTNPDPVGYVDRSGLLAGVEKPASSSESFLNVDFISFPDEESARSALSKQEIQAFYVVSENYLETLDCKLYYDEQPSGEINNQFSELLRVGLLKQTDTKISRRIIDGASPIIEATQDDRQMSTDDWFEVAAPIIAGVFLIVSVFTSSGYLMQAIVEEKENRTMEIIATSLSPTQIMGGKIIALISVGLTQVFAWSLFPVLAVVLIGPYIPFLQNVVLDWKLLLLIVFLAFPTFVLISALMATIGSTVTEAREGQQVSTLITLPVTVPFMLLSSIIANPGGIVAIVLSFFPLTAGLTILLRTAFASVPVWQTGISLFILILSAVGSLWLSGKVFRVGMLRYGKRMSFKDIARALTSRFEEARKETPSHG